MKKIGIIGGMGPAATIDLFDWIVRLTPAKKDQDHLPILISNIPQVPDRTSFLLHGGNTPQPHLVSAAKLLEESGAELLAIPCNTAHAFANEIEDNLSKAKIVNMLQETKRYIEANFPKKETLIGLLATSGTIETQIYQRYLKGYKIITPDQQTQDKVMESIYGQRGIKAGYTRNGRKLLREAVNFLHNMGASVVILGCTEISLVMRNEKNNGVIYINPVKILAKSLIERSLNYVS